jgi:CHAD domain-containing protein
METTSASPENPEPPARRRRRRALDPRMPAGEAARVIARGLLRAIRGRRAGACRGSDPETLHDLRVAMRRTRTCLGEMRRALPADGVRHVRREFGWLGAETGPARDLDVHLALLPEHSASLPEAGRGDLEPLRGHLLERRAAEQQRVREALRSPRCRALLEQWQEFLDEPPPEGATAPEGGRPAGELAAERIARRLERVLERGRAVRSDSPPESLHRLRIECKKLRYLLEFFGPFHDSAVLEAAIRSLKKLQDCLGAVNDLRVQKAALQRFAEEMFREGKATPGLLMALGRLVERLEARHARERGRFEKRFRQFDDRKNRERIRRMLLPHLPVPPSPAGPAPDAP